MLYELKAPVLGFENVSTVNFEKIDGVFSKITAPDGSLSLTLVNPYALREYSFTIPKCVQLLLELDKDSQVEVHCVVVLQKNLEDSMVNFLAPVIFNPKNKTAAQVALLMSDYPDFGLKDPLKSFIVQEAGA